VGVIHVVIEVEGGLVREVRASRSFRPVRYVVVDYDTEGADDDELREYNGRQAYVSGPAEAAPFDIGVPERNV
jgi:hypothetical protein